MTRFKFFKFYNALVVKLLLSFTMVFLSVSLSAQKPVDFTGTWIQDNAKSDAMYRTFNVTLVIKQNPQTITFKQTYIGKDGKELTSNSFSFSLDGKEVTKEEGGGINKQSATWSADKKTLTIKYTRTMEKNLYGSTDTYTLSDDGQVLTVKTADINPDGMKATQVLNKKK